MDLLIILILIILVIFVYKRFSSFVYLIAIIDIFLRIVSFLKHNITSPELYAFLNKNVPLSIPNIIDKYTNGVFNEIFLWFYVIIFIIFEYYIIKSFLKKN